MLNAIFVIATFFAQAGAQPTPAHAFEVATVKPSDPKAAGGTGLFAPPGSNAPPAPAAPAPPPPEPPPPGGGGTRGAPSFQVDHQRFTVSNFTLFALMLLAYDLKGCTGPGESTCALISGGPPWVKSDKFDINAKARDGSPDYTTAQLVTGQAPEVRLMLQTLLADRFSLQIHRETKPLPVYLLTVAKNGPKLKAAAQPGNGSVLWGLAGKPSGEASVHLTAKAASLPRLADSLSNIAGRPVLDQTGLNGSFDFTLEYASEANTPGATPFAGPALFTAFQEQLGLKLEATRAPLEILVIDHVEKPSPN